MRGSRIPQSLKEYVSPSENPLRLANIKEVCSVVIFHFTSIWILFFFSFLCFFIIECNYYLVLEFTFITCRGMTIFNVTFTILCFTIKVACRAKANMIWTTKNSLVFIELIFWLIFRFSIFIFWVSSKWCLIFFLLYWSFWEIRNYF